MKKNKEVMKETVEQYLVRGGQIKKLNRGEGCELKFCGFKSYTKKKVA